MGAQPEAFDVDRPEQKIPELTLVVDNAGSLATGQAVEIIPGFNVNESRTLSLLSQGSSNQEIANALDIKLSAAQVRVSRLKAKLIAENRLQILTHAIAIREWQDYKPAEKTEDYFETNELSVHDTAEIWGTLSSREKRIAELLIDHSPKEIAELERISVGTIYAYLHRSIYRKLSKSGIEDTKKWLQINVAGEESTFANDEGGDELRKSTQAKREIRNPLLTNREIEVLKCIAEGCSYKEVAKRLSIRFATVNKHSVSIYAKLGVDNKDEAVKKGIQLELIDSDLIAVKNYTLSTQEQLDALPQKAGNLLRLMHTNPTNNELAESLGIANITVQGHLKRLREELKVDRQGLVVISRQLLDPNFELARTDEVQNGNELNGQDDDLDEDLKNETGSEGGEFSTRKNESTEENSDDAQTEDTNKRSLPEVVSKREDSLTKLTPRELDALGLLTLGFSNQEIALRMDIEEQTVKYHVGNILRKLNVSNRTSATKKALELGIMKFAMEVENKEDIKAPKMPHTKVILAEMIVDFKNKEPLLVKLTESDKEILNYLSLGMSSVEIASKVFLTSATVKYHLTNIYGKLEVSTRTQATLVAVLFEDKLKPPDLPAEVHEEHTKKSADDKLLDAYKRKLNLGWAGVLRDAIPDEVPDDDVLFDQGAYTGYDQWLYDQDRTRKVNTIAAAADKAVQSLALQGIFDRFNGSGQISARNRSLLERLAEGGYITPEMADAGYIDKVGLLALEASKDPNARSILWGPKSSREIALFELRNAAGSFELERLKAS